MRPLVLVTASCALIVVAWGMAIVTPALIAVVTADGQYLTQRAPAPAVIEVEVRS